jgi:hypothetical protein
MHKFKSYDTQLFTSKWIYLFNLIAYGFLANFIMAELYLISKYQTHSPNYLIYKKTVS